MNSQLYELSQGIYRENRFICEYYDSSSTGQYYPSFELFKQWIEVEYSAQI